MMNEYKYELSIHVFAQSLQYLRSNNLPIHFMLVIQICNLISHLWIKSQVDSNMPFMVIKLYGILPPGCYHTIYMYVIIMHTELLCAKIVIAPVLICPF